MNILGKRALIKMIGLSAVSMAVLTACGKKEEAPAAPLLRQKLRLLLQTSSRSASCM